MALLLGKGISLAARWRLPVAEHPRSGDNVHAALADLAVSLAAVRNR
jgi:hypothetical protein